jgi:hypothetical protein
MMGVQHLAARHRTKSEEASPFEEWMGIDEVDDLLPVRAAQDAAPISSTSLGSTLSMDG